MSEVGNLKVGDTLYFFSVNRRAWDKDGQTVYRYHFEPMQIIGENRRSWLFKYGWKCDKATLKSAASMEFGGRGFFTKEQMEDDIWLHNNRHNLADLVRVSPIEALRSVAEVLGYESAVEPTVRAAPPRGEHD